MRKLKFVSSALAGLALLGGYSWHATAADKTDTAQSLHWAVPAGAAKYGAIDGKHLWQYVVEQAGIARHYRDNGHPQFWGRFAGTSGDDEDAQWLLDKYRQIGLTDTHAQTVSFLRPAIVGPVLEHDGDGRRQDGADFVGAAGLWQPGNGWQGA